MLRSKNDNMKLAFLYAVLQWSSQLSLLSIVIPKYLAADCDSKTTLCIVYLFRIGSRLLVILKRVHFSG